MTELKTFKEIINEALKGVPKGSQAEAVIRVLEQCLKSEAVKWLKRADKDFTHRPEFKTGAVWFILNFFNPKEEDLKLTTKNKQ